jgi:hypothetical protein
LLPLLLPVVLQVHDLTPALLLLQAVRVYQRILRCTYLRLLLLP